jgi:anti-sigma factor (TIGR02949 family)
MSEVSCEEVLAEIERYVDGEMDAPRATVLLDHLRSCSPCLDRADFQARLKAIVRRKCSGPAHQAPEGLITRVRVAIRTERIDVEGPETV